MSRKPNPLFPVIAAEAKEGYDPWSDCDTFNRQHITDPEPTQDALRKEAPKPSPYAALITAQGEPFLLNKHGTYTINEMFFAARFASCRDVLYEPGENRFYLYDAGTGLWKYETDHAIKIMVSDDIMGFVTSEKASGLALKRTDRVLTAITAILRGLRQERDAFEKPHGLIHAANGMVDLGTGIPVVKAFEPCYRSRNQTPFIYEPAARCEKFLNELLVPALPPEDIDLLQRWAGAVLLGGNEAQRLMILTGTAGGGKSTLVSILESVIGKANVAQLRTPMLDRPFEQARYLGRLLLCGKDVKGDFLSHNSASNLKALIGGDLLTPELKGSNEVPAMVGNFAVAITCNARLRIKLEQDIEAWRRRLLIVEYAAPKPAVPVPGFAQKLLKAEGSGILRWFIEGALKHRAELAVTGNYGLTVTQKERINTLLSESDSVRAFVNSALVKDAEADVSVDELHHAYGAFCDERDWSGVSDQAFREQVAELIREKFKIAKRNDISRGKQVRGFKGVRVMP